MTHLIYLHQGHLSLPDEMLPIAKILTPILDGECYISQANATKLSTAWGIEPAADRVVDEIQALLESRSYVETLSMVGVSLGGVILRRAVEKLFNHTVGVNRVPVELRYFITIASPLNGLTPGWNLATLAVKLLGWADKTLVELYNMHDKPSPSVSGLALFHQRICLVNLVGDWRVPLTSALPVGGNWPWWLPGTQRMKQVALDSTTCIWYIIMLDLSDQRNVHHAIETDVRGMDALRRIVDE